MKKLILLVAILLSFSLNINTFATDACDKFIPQNASFMGKATIAANLRSYPCTYKSSVLGVSKVGDIYEIISKVDGWYQIKTTDNNTYWIWDQAIIKTGEVSSNHYSYKLTSQDNIIINRFIYKVDKVVQEKGLHIRNNLVYQLDNILKTRKLTSRVKTILEVIKSRVNAIQLKVQEINESQNQEQETITYTYNLDNIDIGVVKSTWLSWYNDVRTSLGLNQYTYDSKLESTAIDWSKTSKDRGEISHQRNPGDSYYDYDKITDWFADRGVVCKNIYGVTNTENIGWGTYSCNDGDCTDELINGIRSTFDFYMAEKNQSYQAHYKSIVSPYFTKMGLGIELEQIRTGYYKYYLTVHYCTELVEQKYLGSKLKSDF